MRRRPRRLRRILVLFWKKVKNLQITGRRFGLRWDSLLRPTKAHISRLKCTTSIYYDSCHLVVHYRTIEYPWKKASDEQLSVCLICKDPQREYKTKVGSLSLGSVKKIIGISKLKLKYKPFEAKRQLCDLYDVFIADDRILPLLPKALGKTFFAKKKLPIPVSLDKTGEALKRELVGSIEATTLNLNTGSCLSIKVGQIHQDVPHVVKNVMTVIKEVIEKVPGKASNVRSLHLKTGESVALPVFLRQQQQ